MSSKAKVAFLTAEWKHLAMLNYSIEPSILAPFMPAGTELNTWNGTNYVSIVGFLFANTRLSGYAIPFHRNFEEVNLRFYVRRKTDDGWKRGVVFIKEIVPRSMIALVAQSRRYSNHRSRCLSLCHAANLVGVADLSIRHRSGIP